MDQKEGLEKSSSVVLGTLGFLDLGEKKTDLKNNVKMLYTSLHVHEYYVGLYENEDQLG